MNNAVLEQFDRQRSRGTEGFGLFDGQELNMVHATNEDKILKWLCKYDSNLLMFHHRWPTSTVNVKKAAHPFSTKDHFKDQYIMIHNGVISNPRELFDKHQEMGIKYYSLLDNGTFNDSEALLWDLALTLENKQPKLTATGTIAFVCIKLSRGKLNRLYFGRNTNPLNMFRTEDGIALSSEGAGEAIEPDTLYTFNYDLKRLTSRYFKVPKTNYAAYNPSDYEYRGYGSSYNGRYNDYRYSDYDDDYTDSNYTDKSWDAIGKKVGKGMSKLGTILKGTHGDYRYDEKNQMYLPITEKDYKYYEDDYDYEDVKPLKRDVDSTLFEYMLEGEGNFEDTYWLLEAAYEELEMRPDNLSTHRERALLEACMSEIVKDPEYIDNDSVSSMWRNICKNT